MASSAELMEHELSKGQFEFVSTIVSTEEDFLKALIKFKPDLILSDYSLPQFDGLSALKIAKKLAVMIPFIIVTGRLSEETAVDCIKAGGWDYVVKEHLARLAPAVKNALQLNA